MGRHSPATPTYSTPTIPPVDVAPEIKLDTSLSWGVTGYVENYMPTPTQIEHSSSPDSEALSRSRSKTLVPTSVFDPPSTGVKPHPAPQSLEPPLPGLPPRKSCAHHAAHSFQRRYLRSSRSRNYDHSGTAIVRRGSYTPKPYTPTPMLNSRPSLTSFACTQGAQRGLAHQDRYEVTTSPKPFLPFRWKECSRMQRLSKQCPSVQPSDDGNPSDEQGALRYVTVSSASESSMSLRGIEGAALSLWDRGAGAESITQGQTLLGTIKTQGGCGPQGASRVGRDLSRTRER